MSNCMPLMSDGRNFTEYRPSCYVTNMIAQQNGVSSSYDLKQLLIHNTNELMKLERQHYESKSCLDRCHGAFITPDPNHNDIQNDKYLAQLMMRRS